MPALLWQGAAAPDDLSHHLTLNFSSSDFLQGQENPMPSSFLTLSPVPTSWSPQPADPPTQEQQSLISRLLLHLHLFHLYSSLPHLKVFPASFPPARAACPCPSNCGIFPAGQGSADALRVGPVQGPGRAQPLHGLEAPGHFLLQHGAGALSRAFPSSGSSSSPELAPASTGSGPGWGF